MKLPLLFKQMTVRSGAIVIVKAMGLVGRVSLTRLIGAEGIGIYQIAYSYYGLILMIITGGLPTTLAIFTAKHPAHGWTWFKLFSLLLMIVGGALSLLSFWFSDQIAITLGNPDIYYSIRCLAPAIFAVPLLSLLRGYLQGLEQYGLIAVSELVEQMIRVISMLLLALFLLSNGPALAAGGSMLGTLLGGIISFAMLIIYLMFYNKRFNTIPHHEVVRVDYNATLKWFLQSSLIISFTRLLVPFSDVLDAIIIPNRLQAAGYSPSQATAMFGILTGMAMIVVYMPTIITAALSHTMTVKIVSEWREGKHAHFYRRTRIILEFGWVWGFASSLLLFVYHKDLSMLIFGTPEAGEPIKYLSVIPLLVGLRELTTSILWAQERRKIPFIGLAVGISCAVVLHYFLIAIPGLNFGGAAVGILTLELLAVIWNIRTLLVEIKELNYFRLLLDLFVIGGIMILVLLIFETSIAQLFSEQIRACLGMLLFGGSSAIYIFFRFQRHYNMIS